VLNAKRRFGSNPKEGVGRILSNERRWVGERGQDLGQGRGAVRAEIGYRFA